MHAIIDVTEGGDVGKLRSLISGNNGRKSAVADTNIARQRKIKKLWCEITHAHVVKSRVASHKEEYI